MAKQKSLSKVKQDVQKVFNKYIRMRDEGKPCISCGKYVERGDAGHFFPVSTHDGIRYDPDNCHLECRYDNAFNQGHLIFYRDNLLEKIGQERYNALHKRAADYKKNGYKWTRSELAEIKKKYSDKIKEL